MCEQTQKAVRKISAHIAIILAGIMVLALMLSVHYMQRQWHDDSKMARALALSLNQTGTGIMQVDSDADIIGWNSAMAELTGYTKEEATGKPLSFMMPSTMGALHDTKVREALHADTTINSHKVVILSTQLNHKDGHTVDVKVRAYIVPGQHTGIALVDASDKVVQHSTTP